jgi:DNA-binding response OmpR family regulator
MSKAIDVGNPSAGPAEPGRRVLAHEDQAASHLTGSRKPRLILLFTADPGVQERLEEALHGSSAIILVAHNLRDAIEIILAQGGAVECAIVDIEQEFSGITLLGALGAYRGRVSIIVIAANSADAELVIDRPEGMRFLTKPLSAGVLAAALTYRPERCPRPVAA